MKRALLPLLLALATPGLADDFGPIATRNHRALSLPFLRLIPKGSVLGPDEARLDVGWTVANDFRELPSTGPFLVLEDQETSRVVFGYRKGLTHDSEWFVEAPVLIRSGGFLDPIIAWWHRHVLGWTDPARAAAPEGRCIVDVPGASFGSATGLGDVTVGYSRILARCLIGSAAVKLPTGDANRLLGSGAVDGGVAVDLRLPLGGPWTFFAQGGLVAQGQATALPNSRDFVHQEMIALMWKPNSRDAWIAQWHGEASATRTGVHGSDATHRLLTFGYQRRLSNRQLLEMFFSEDRDVFNGSFPEGSNIGPDFTAGLRLSIKL